MDNEQSRQRASSSSGGSERKISDSIRFFVGQLATALGQVIPAERVLLYIHALSDLTEKQLAHGFDQALKRFSAEFGKTFPLPADIREWAFEYRAVDPIAETRRLLARDDKPPDWEELGRHSGVTPEQTARWLEEGKQKQREHNAQLARDPEWQRLAQLAEVPGYRAPLATPSTIPADPVERARWARNKAIEHGWKGAQ